MANISDITADNIPTTDAHTALAQLKTGNKAYLAGEHYTDHHQGREGRISVQYPFAAIVGCADSRVAPELLFNVAPGDLFVVRVAGNFVNDDGLASLEYASEFLDTKLIVVLGHSGCGAVSAAIKVVKKDVPLPGNLPNLVANIKPAIKPNLLASLQDGDLKDELDKVMPELLDTAIIDNVKANVETLKNSAVIGQRVKDGDMLVVGAVYELASGQVVFL